MDILKEELVEFFEPVSRGARLAQEWMNEAEEAFEEQVMEWLSEQAEELSLKLEIDWKKDGF